MPEIFEKLRNHLPEFIFNQLGKAIRNGNCTPEQYKNRVNHFLSQCAHESQNFTRLTENLNYSYEGLLKTFKKYFTPITAAECAHQPEKIANIVYGGRLGNTEPGDGWKFRGRGCLQITGRENYHAFQNMLWVQQNELSEDDFNIILGNPDIVATDYALLSATWFFDKNNIWDICDEGNDNLTIRKVTRRINGGFVGLDERIKLFRKFESILNTGL